MRIHNDWTYSEDLTQSAYTLNGVTLGATTTIAGVSLTRVVEDVSVGVHRVTRSIGPSAMTDNALQAFSLFALAGERTWLEVLLTNKANASFGAYVNLATGAVGTTSSLTPTVTAAGAGWRIGFVVSSGTGSNSTILRVNLASADGTDSYAGNTANGFSIGGFQWEKDVAMPGPYLATGASAVARIFGRRTIAAIQRGR